LALGHGLGDFNAGVVLASLGAHVGGDLVVLFLCYNTLAFAGQPVVGWIADRAGSPLAWFLAGGVASAASLTFSGNDPWLAVVLSGVASAMYHSGGGAAAWMLGRQSALAVGVFSAPGVLGLALGLSIGSSLGFSATMGIAAAILAVVFALAILRRMIARAAPRAAHAPGDRRALLGGIAGWVILFAIAARSFAWTLGQDAIFPADAAVAIAVAAAIGKGVAGFLADKWGFESVAIGALGVAICLLMLSRSWMILLFPAAASLQAGTGPMMALALKAWPSRPAFASGLAQGLAVAVGGAPLFLMRERPKAPWLVAVALLAIAMLLVWRERRLKGGLDTI